MNGATSPPVLLHGMHVDKRKFEEFRSVLCRNKWRMLRSVTALVVPDFWNVPEEPTPETPCDRFKCSWRKWIP